MCETPSAPIHNVLHVAHRTFQERLLSRRCLIFAEGRFYFQCRTIGLSQDIHTDGNGNGWELGQTNSSLRAFKELHQRPMWFFLHCIRSYTGRQLTNPDDVFAAFSGAIQLLELYMNTDIVFGIPTSHFDLALLWTPVGRVTRRGKRRCQQMGSVCIKDPTGICTCPLVTDITGGQSIPTWSWAGWTGEKIDYRDESLSGCLGDVHHWLTYRTWIQWYIRDKNGILRPLWKRLQCDGNFAQQRSDVLDEWRGYRCTYEPISDSTTSTSGRKRPRLSQLVTGGYPEVRRTSNQQYITRARDTSYAYSPAPTI